jgi:AhpD family alkylhydroperoxidase
LVSRLKDRGIEQTAIIGRIVSKSKGKIMLKKNIKSKSPHIVSPEDKGKKEAEIETLAHTPEAHSECCPSPPEVSAEGDATQIKEKFEEFMSEVGREGTISARNKVLMSISLSLLSKCEPCVKTHIDKARTLGISEEEINEALWMAVSFGGSPILMFYNSIKEE